MLSFESKGSFTNTENFLNHMSKLNILQILDSSGKEGVLALSRATPIDSGKTSKSWGYKVTHGKGTYTITWTNSEIENGFPVAIMIQYGHATRGGGFVVGRDYINPAIRPIFDQIADKAWKEVTSA